MWILVDTRFNHLVIKIVALAGALADAGEHRIAAVRLGDVIDQFHDEYGLADAGTTEQADLATLRVRRKQIHHFDAGDQDLRFRRLVHKGWRGLMDGAPLLGVDGPSFVDGIADNIDYAAERLVADRHRDRRAGVDDLLAADQ